MISLQNRKYAATNKELTDSLFVRGGTCDGLYVDLVGLPVEVNSPSDDNHGDTGTIYRAFKTACTVKIDDTVNSFSYDELKAI